MEWLSAFCAMERGQKIKRRRWKVAQYLYLLPSGTQKIALRNPRRTTDEAYSCPLKSWLDARDWETVQ